MRALLAAVLLCLHQGGILAAPIAQAVVQDLVVVLYDEPCALEAVSNLRQRATWRQGVENFEGCWGVSPLGFIMFYFSDRTVAGIPRQIFRPVSGT